MSRSICFVYVSGIPVGNYFPQALWVLGGIRVCAIFTPLVILLVDQPTVPPSFLPQENDLTLKFENASHITQERWKVCFL